MSVAHLCADRLAEKSHNSHGLGKRLAIIAQDHVEARSQSELGVPSKTWCEQCIVCMHGHTTKVKFISSLLTLS